ncbi:MAG: hypothetical protein FJY85_13910, partial [Deltaproteobacteria bacterium]|nr:hypothetical protein [Deltaproteobacteria bacterium]
GASIVAKVTRDRIMKDLHAQYPMYGFDKHKGYGTKAHKEAIQRHGPSPAHRLCFKGVKDRYKCPGGSLSRRSEGRPRR